MLDTDLNASAALNATELDRDENIALIEVSVSATILFLAVAGNVCVLVSLATRRRRLTRMHLMILHLSLADLFVAFFNVLPQLAWDITYRFEGGQVLCVGVKYCQVVAMYASSYVLLATAIDRYYAICHPFTSHMWSARHAHILVAVAWLASLLFSLPQVVIFSMQEVEPNSGVYDCWASFSPLWTLKLYVTWMTASIFVIPTGLLGLLYGRITLAVWRAGRMHTSMTRRYSTSWEANYTTLHHQSFRATSQKHTPSMALSVRKTPSPEPKAVSPSSVSVPQAHCCPGHAVNAAAADNHHNANGIARINSNTNDHEHRKTVHLRKNPCAKEVCGKGPATNSSLENGCKFRPAECKPALVMNGFTCASNVPRGIDPNACSFHAKHLTLVTNSERTFYLLKNGDKSLSTSALPSCWPNNTRSLGCVPRIQSCCGSRSTNCTSCRSRSSTWASTEFQRNSVESFDCQSSSRVGLSPPRPADVGGVASVTTETPPPPIACTCSKTSTLRRPSQSWSNLLTGDGDPNPSSLQIPAGQEKTALDCPSNDFHSPSLSSCHQLLCGESQSNTSLQKQPQWKETKTNLVGKTHGCVSQCSHDVAGIERLRDTHSQSVAKSGEPSKPRQTYTIYRGGSGKTSTVCHDVNFSTERSGNQAMLSDNCSDDPYTKPRLDQTYQNSSKSTSLIDHQTSNSAYQCREGIYRENSAPLQLSHSRAAYPDLQNESPGLCGRVPSRDACPPAQPVSVRVTENGSSQRLGNVSQTSGHSPQMVRSGRSPSPPDHHCGPGISRAKLKTVKMTITVVICYIVCWAPFFVGQMWAAFDESAYQGHFVAIILLLASMNSCTNPWIYTAFSDSICRRTNTLLRKPGRRIASCLRRWGCPWTICRLLQGKTKSALRKRGREGTEVRPNSRTVFRSRFAPKESLAGRTEPSRLGEGMHLVVSGKKGNYYSEESCDADSTDERAAGKQTQRDVRCCKKKRKTTGRKQKLRKQETFSTVC